MSLRFVYGRAGSGKSSFCLQDIKERLETKENKRYILLVPEQFSYQTEKNMLRIIGEKGLLQAEVLSFGRMAHRVFGEVGGITHQHMNAAGKSMLLYRILEQIKDEFKVFARASRQQGFIKVISEIISEMKRYNITPEHLFLVQQEIKEESQDLLKDKLTEIHNIYYRFEEALHKNYIDTDDELKMLGDKLQGSSLYDGAEIWIDEFASFTPQQYRVLEKLFAKADRITITLCTNYSRTAADGEAAELFAITQNTEDKLLKLAKENNLSLDKPVYLPLIGEQHRFKSSEELQHMERGLFTYPYNCYRGPVKDIGILRSANLYAEVEYVAREIIRLCRDQDFRYRDIAVVTRDLPRYGKLVESVFSDYDIPYFIDQKREVSGNPLVLLILSAIDILSKNWSYEAVFRYLKTGLFPIEQENVDILENYVLSAGIKGKKWTQEEPWTYIYSQSFSGTEKSEHEEEILEKVNEIRNQVRSPLLTFHHNLASAANAREMCIALYEFLSSIGVPETIQQWIETFQRAGMLDNVSEYAQIWNIVVDLLDQIVEVLGDEKLDVKGFTKILSVGFGEYQIGLIPPALDQVLVSSVERVKSHEVNALFIIGVNDGVFPAASNEEGILSDNDRELLEAYGLELAKTTKSRVFEEDFLVYTTLTIPQRVLKVSYPIANHEGKTLRPSKVVSWLKKLFPKLQEESNIIERDSEEENLASISRPSPTFNGLINSMRRREDGQSFHSLWQNAYDWYMGREDWKDKCEWMLKGLNYTNQVEKIQKEKIKKIYGKQMRFSVSRFEKYVSCPFAYYVQYGLKAKERKVYRLTYPDLGTFMHAILDRFSNYIKEQKLQWREIEKEWCKQKVVEIVQELAAEEQYSIFESSSRHQYITERLKRVLTRAVWLIIEHIRRGGFEPLQYELAFGEGEEIPPIQVKLSTGENIELIGRIDRIDGMHMDEGVYLRIIDYKSGTKDLKLSDVYYGLQIQLLTYLDALLSSNENIDGKPVVPAGVLYFKIDDPVLKGKGTLTEEEIEKGIMKKLKMRGLLLADAKVIREMDREMEGSSLIIPARINKDGTLGSSRAASKEQFELLRKYVRNKLRVICEEMLEGNIAMKPYKKKDATSCMYCSFAPICQFDANLEGNEYNLIRDKKDEEVWKLLGEEVEKEGDGRK